MPKIEFEEAFKRKGMFDYNKLSLEQGEKARVCVMDSPNMEYVHTLRKVITENGRPIMETQSYGRNFEKTREVPKTDFVGKYLCLGELDKLTTQGADPDNCPACKAAVENGSAVDTAKRRFVVHVLKYVTKKNSFNLQEPYQASLLAWEFAESRFGQLVDISTEHGKLNGVDLLLGPCTNKGFQKYDITAGAPPAEWTKGDGRKMTTREIVTNQRADDLTPLLGRRVEPVELRSVVNDVVHTYNAAFNIQSAFAESTNTNTDSDLTDLLNSDSTESTSNAPVDDDPFAEFEPKTETAASGDADAEDLFAQAESENKTEPTNEELAADKKDEKKEEKSEVEDLDDLLAGL